MEIAFMFPYSWLSIFFAVVKFHQEKYPTFCHTHKKYVGRSTPLPESRLSEISSNMFVYVV